jgi:D-tyrosyl-tRNA(Tyr) deacylase
MRAVIQRVAQASVTGGGQTATIGRGLCVFVGFAQEDTDEDLNFICRRISEAKIFPEVSDESEKQNGRARWARSVFDLGGEILLISQFTLHGVFKSNKSVSFHRSMAPERARLFFERVYLTLQGLMPRPDLVKKCVFGSYMNVSVVNDGPVTIVVDSRQPKG